jgi:HlyD family type I secretion membrane fusion protein
MAKPLTNQSLDAINTNEFLPTVNWWVTAGSWFMVMVLIGAAIAASLVTYRTTVKVPAILRPAGDARLVQAATTGRVVEIKGANNKAVKQGEVIAKLDTASLEAQAIQLLANLDQGKSKLQQINAQMITADQQIAAEAAQAQRSIAASAADYDQIQRTQQNQTVSAQAAVEEAQAQINLAASEVDSYRQLVESGAVSRLQLAEKQAALETAQARMVGLQAALNPSSGDVQAAQQRIAQAQAGGAATLARLQQSKQQLAQQALEIQEQLQKTEQEIAQVNLSLQNSTVRSPVDGTLHELSLRNTGQVINPGETIATVIPAQASIEIRAMVPAQEINKVDVGMKTQMRLSACPFSEFGTVPGEVKAISPDMVSQQSMGGSSSDGKDSGGGGGAPRGRGAFYSVLIVTDVATLPSSAGNPPCPLQPGTEGEVTIISREETVITFLRRKASLTTKL